MRIDIVTLFPEFFTSPLQTSLLGKAIANQIADVYLTNPRDFTTDKHHRVDDEPYGGGVGMLMKPDPIFAAVESLPILPKREIIYLTPQGEPMKQDLFKDLVTREVSLGDFVLTCGEIPALALINGVVRLRPGTVGKEDSLKFESFEDGLLDYPQYTRPSVFRDWEVPEVLRSGNHKLIAEWRKEQQILRTKQRRPDLLSN
jgi:tRNA (guanine37-N1)-methyltransferase